MSTSACTIRIGRPTDVPTIFGLIKGLAEYEKLSHEVVGTEELLREHLFGERPYLRGAAGRGRRHARSGSRCSSTTTRRF